MLRSDENKSCANFIDELVENKQGNSRFDEYASVFQNLTEQTSLSTSGSVIVNIIINDLQDAILVLVKEADEIFFVQIFDIKTKM